MFGFFWLIHGGFIGALRTGLQFRTVPLDAKLWAVSSVLTALAVSQVVQFSRDAHRVFSKHQGKPNYAKTTLDRVVKLQVGLLATMFVTLAVGFPRPLLVGIVVLKVAYELSL